MTTIATANLYIWILLVPLAIIMAVLAEHKGAAARVMLTILWLVLVCVGVPIVGRTAAEMSDWQRSALQWGGASAIVLTLIFVVAWVPDDSPLHRRRAAQPQPAPQPAPQQAAQPQAQPAASGNWTTPQTTAAQPSPVQPQRPGATIPLRSRVVVRGHGPGVLCADQRSHAGIEYSVRLDSGIDVTVPASEVTLAPPAPAPQPRPVTRTVSTQTPIPVPVRGYRPKRRPPLR